MAYTARNVPIGGGYTSPDVTLGGGYTADYSVPYTDKLVAKMEADDQTTAFELPGGHKSADILNDPAFSLYDFDKLRTFQDDPYLIAGQKLRDWNVLREINRLHSGSAGYTYLDDGPPDPQKVYVDELGQFKSDWSPAATHEGRVNKELATVMSHEFRHNLLQSPEYSGIVKNLYDKFAGNIPIYNRSGGLEEYINTAADLQLNPDAPGDVGYLEDFKNKYNRKLIKQGMPEHLSPVDTTKYFDNAATVFFDQVRKNKIKQKEKQMRYSALQARIGRDRAMIPGDGRVFQPTGGDGGGWSPSGADLSPGGGYGQSPTGSDIAGTPFSRGGILGAF